MITLHLTEWEVMVLRAALDRHVRAKGVSQKHIDSARVIIAKSREQDDPIAALVNLAK